MSKKTAAGAPQETTLLYDKLVATNAKVERKGATVPQTTSARQAHCKPDAGCPLLRTRASPSRR